MRALNSPWSFWGFQPDTCGLTGSALGGFLQWIQAQIICWENDASASQLKLLDGSWLEECWSSKWHLKKKRSTVWPKHNWFRSRNYNLEKNCARTLNQHDWQRQDRFALKNSEHLWQHFKLYTSSIISNFNLVGWWATRGDLKETHE